MGLFGLTKDQLATLIDATRLLPGIMYVFKSTQICGKANIFTCLKRDIKIFFVKCGILKTQKVSVKISSNICTPDFNAIRVYP